MSGKYQRRITNTVRRHRLDYMLLQYKSKIKSKVYMSFEESLFSISKWTFINK